MEKVMKWESHYPKEIPMTIDYDEIPLYAFLENAVERFNEKKALHFMGKELTYQEVYNQARKVANYLQTLGLQKGDRVATMLPNCPQSVISYYGVLMAGGIVVQTNPLYTERELEFQLFDSGAEFIVCLDILLPTVSKVKNNTFLKHIIVTGIKDYLPFPKNVIYPFIQKKEHNMVVNPEQSDTIHLWKNVMKRVSTNYRKIEVNPKEDVALFQYTGGTTGYPKGVMLTHYNLVSNAQMCDAWLYGTKKGEEVILGVLPLFHVYGLTTLMNLSTVVKAKLILLPKFKPKEVLKTIDKLKPTLFPGAPTIYIGLLNHPDLQKYDLSSIKASISGSAPLPLDVQQRFEEVTGGKIVEGYGLTESSPVTHANLIWGKRQNGSIGIPWPDTNAKIYRIGTEEEADIDEVGEIAVKGPQVMKGYWNNEEETANTLRDGWLFTGDLGYMDEEGFFYVVDRSKDVIIAGGFNIFPREVEEVLYEHEGVQEAVIVGIPDSYRGETVKAYVVPKEGYTLDEEELNTYCRQNLAAFKVPRAYEFRDELPKTTVGKILRRQLVDEEVNKNQSV